MKLLISRIMLIIILTGAITACSSTPSAPEKILPAHLEDIEGSEFKRVILTEKAADRIDIQTDLVRETSVTPTLRVGGEVVSSKSTMENGTATATTGSVVLVHLNKNGLQQIDKGKQAVILPLINNTSDQGIAAKSVDLIVEEDDVEDTDDGDDLYLEVIDDDENLDIGLRVFVDLPLIDTNPLRKVVPYAAVIYGVNGETWVYVNSEPLIFIRYPIVVDYIDGNQAILLEGPKVGTTVVIVGVAELFGAETGVSK